MYACFNNVLTAQEIRAAWQNVESDIAAGVLTPRGGLWHRVLSEAETMAVSHTPVLGTRTLGRYPCSCGKDSRPLASFAPVIPDNQAWQFNSD